MLGAMSKKTTLTPRRRPRGAPFLGRALIAVAVTVAASAVVPPGQAQELGVSMELARQPLYHRPGDRLDIAISVRNRTERPLRGGRLVLSVEDRVSSRSALHESFEGPTSVLPSAFPVDFDRRIPPLGRGTIRIRERVSDFVLLDQATEGGVYPLTITLLNTDSEVLDSLGTPLIYYPSSPQPPLKIVVVAPLNTLPARDFDGIFRSDELESATAGSGWLAGLVEAMDRRAGSNGLHLGVAPTPRLVEELDDMTNGFRRAGDVGPEAAGPASRAARDAAALLEGLERLLQRRGVQRILVPYSAPDLPFLADQTFDDQALDKQIQTGLKVLEAGLGLGFDSEWLLPPEGRLDHRSMEELSLCGTASRTFMSRDSLVELGDPAHAGCPQSFTSFTCPVRIKTAGAEPILGFATDAGLGDRLEDLTVAGNERVDLQRFFAETAMIREESPGIQGRVVQTTLPSAWTPSPRLAESLFRGLSTAPWLATVSPEEGISAAPSRARRLVGVAARLQPQPTEPDFAALGSAATAIARYDSIQPPAGRVEDLRRDLLVAQSRMWWTDAGLLERGLAYAQGASQDVDEEFAKIAVQLAEEVTLSSRRAPIPISLTNGTGYPVTVAVVLSSDKLRGGREVVRRTFGPEPNLPLKIFATPEASGSFPLEVHLATPDGYIFFTDRDTTIRSTEFNRIALGITIGALLFLILFYTLRLLRRRGENEKGPAGVTQT